MPVLPSALVLSGHQGARAGAITITGPQALLVSNNAYDTSDIGGLGHRARLGTGALGVVAVTANSAVLAVNCWAVRGASSPPTRSWSTLTYRRSRSASTARPL